MAEKLPDYIISNYVDKMILLGNAQKMPISKQLKRYILQIIFRLKLWARSIRGEI